MQITEGKNLSDFANFKIVNDGFPNGTPFITLEFPSPEIPSGIKFDEVDDYGEYYVNTFYFDTNLPPVWGDFYAKGGRIFAYNNGFGIEPAGTNFTDWIARPDGIVVPIPGSVLLMGSGLLGLIGIRRKLS